MFYLCRVWIICLCVGVDCVVISVVWIGVFLLDGNIVCRVCSVDRKLWNGLLFRGLCVFLCLCWLKVFIFCLCEICLFLLLKIIVLLLKVMCSCLVGWFRLSCLVVVMVLFGGLGRIVVVVMLCSSVCCIDLGLVDRKRLVLNGFMYGQVGLSVVNVVWMMFSLQCWIELKMCSLVLVELCDSRIIFICGDFGDCFWLSVNSLCIIGKVMLGCSILFLCLCWYLVQVFMFFVLNSVWFFFRLNRVCEVMVMVSKWGVLLFMLVSYLMWLDWLVSYCLLKYELFVEDLVFQVVFGVEQYCYLVFV